MNVRTTIIAVVIFAVLLGLVIAFNPAQGGADGTATPIPTISTTKLEDVEEVRVEDAEGQRVVVQRGENGDWNLVEPEAGVADRSRVTALLSQLLLRPPERRITDDSASIAQYGLDRPRFEVALKTTSGDETYVFGATNPNQTAIYMQRQGSPTVWLMTSLQSTLQDFVQRPPKATPTPEASPTPAEATSPAGTPQPAGMSPTAAATPVLTLPTAAATPVPTDASP